MSSSARTTQRCERNGSSATRARSAPSRDGTSTTPPSSGRRNDAATVHAGPARAGARPPAAGARCRGCRRRRRPSAPVRPRSSSASVDDLLGSRARAPRCRTGRRRRGPASTCFGRRRSPAISASTAAVLVGPAAPAHRLADVPVGGVEEPHAAAPRTGRRAAVVAAAADGARRPRSARVAHAGNGNWTTSGTGSSGWLTSIVPGLRIVARWRCDAGQEPVLAPAGLGGVEPADDPDRRVGDDAALDLARRLLRADQDDAEGPAPLGHVEQDLLDRARAFAGRVLVELVEHDELQRAGPCPARSLSLERLAQHDADDEPLGPVVEVVQVDHRDLVRSKSTRWRSGSGDVGPDEVLEVAARRRSSRRMNALTVPCADGPPGPALARRVVVRSSFAAISVDELAERADRRRPRCATAAVAGRRRPRVSRAVTLCTTIVYCWRSSSASANRNGSSSSAAELARASRRTT